MCAGVQVHVVGHQEAAGAETFVAPVRAVRSFQRVGAEVGRPLGGAQLAAQRLVLALAHVGQVAPLRARGGVLVEVDGDLQFVADAPTDLRGPVRRALVHRRRRAPARTGRRRSRRGGDGRRGGGSCRSARRRGARRGRPPRPRASGGPMKVMTVRLVSAPGSTSSRRDAFDLADDGGHGVDDAAVAAFADVRNALDELLHAGYLAADRVRHRRRRWRPGHDNPAGWRIPAPGPGHATLPAGMRLVRRVCPRASSTRTRFPAKGRP